MRYVRPSATIIEDTCRRAVTSTLSELAWRVGIGMRIRWWLNVDETRLPSELAAQIAAANDARAAHTLACAVVHASQLEGSHTLRFCDPDPSRFPGRMPSSDAASLPLDGTMAWPQVRESPA
jgi:hypothetical protein